MLHHPYIIGGPQQGGTKSEVAALPLPSRGPKRGGICYVIPAFSEVPSKGEQNQKWLPHPCLLMGAKGGGSAMSLLHSWGSPTKGEKIRSGCLTPVFSGAQKGVEMPRHPAFSGVSNKREQNQKWVPHPCVLRGAKGGGSAMSLLHSWGSPTKGNKIRSGCLALAFSGAETGAEMLRDPYILGGPQQRGTKSQVGASPLPFQGRKRGRKCYITTAFSGVPNKREQNQKWMPQPRLLGGAKGGKCAITLLHSRGSPTKGNKIRSGCLTRAFSVAQNWAKMLHHPCILGGPQQRGTKSEVAASPVRFQGPKGGQKWYVTPAFSGVPNKGGQHKKWLFHPYLPWDPKEGKTATSPLPSRGSPTKGNKIRSGCLTPAFSAAQKGAEMLRHTCILGCPQQRRSKSEDTASPLPSEGPKRKRKCYGTHALSWVPNKGQHNQKWVHHPCLFKGPNGGGNATSPVHSRGSPTKGNKIRSGCLTPAFSGAQKGAAMLRHTCILGCPQQRGSKSEDAASPLPSEGPKRRRKCYGTPTLSWVPNKGQQNQKWLHHPCLFKGPKRGGNATSPMHSRGSPTKGNKISSGCLTPAFSRAQKGPEMVRYACILGGPQQKGTTSEIGGPLQRGTKSEVAASPLPSEGPKRGWKWYVAPAFSGVPNKGEENQKWLPHSCLFKGPKEGGNAISPLHSRGSPTKGKKIRSGSLTLVFSRAQKSAELLHHPDILGGSQQRGTKSEVGASPLPSQGPKIGQKWYGTSAFSGVPIKGEQREDHDWLPHPCIFKGP